MSRSKNIKIKINKELLKIRHQEKIKTFTKVINNIITRSQQKIKLKKTNGEEE